LFIDRPSPTDPSSTPTDIDIYLSVREKSRILLKTGTDVGNAEGSAYANLLARNLFGGAETLNLNASLGTRTRSAYQASFETPFLSNPDFRGETGGLASSTQKSWSSHEEVLKGGWAKLRWIARGGSRHELGYNGVWRQITGLAGNASPTVRGDAGDSVKSSISHTWMSDQRDNPILATRGHYMKTNLELAGWGPLQGDVAFGKAEAETQAAVPIPIPGIEGDSGVSFTAGLRGGFLYPLPLGFDTKPTPSRINDRFQLGGPTDIRGFRLSGLGPRDGADAVGGDVYAAGSANLLVPLPRVGADKPFRMQAFVNGGRLLALKQAPADGNDGARTVQKSLGSTISELGNGLPSMAAGVGLVYAHPVARFELNFSLPLVLRKGEEGRKGLQFGVGINLL
jgi:outer membrane protein insertion porin family